MLRIESLEKDLVEQVMNSLPAPGSPEGFQTAVVLPSRRMGVFLLDALAGRVAATHLPPEIMTVDDFMNRLFGYNFPGSRVLSDIEACLLLYHILEKRTGGVLYTGKIEKGDFPGFFPWGLRIQQTLEEIVLESRDFHSLDRTIYERFVGLGDYHEKYRRFISDLPGLVNTYLEALQEGRKATRSSVYRRLGDRAEHQELEVFPCKYFIFAGLNALNYSEERILRYMVEHHHSDLILRSDPAALDDPAGPFVLQARTIETLGFTLPPKPRKPAPTLWNHFHPKVRLMPCANTETQMAQVFEVLQDLVGKRPSARLRDIGVVMADASSLIPFVQGVISRFEQEQHPVPFNITLGYPFKRTPLYQLIDLMLKAGENREAGCVSSRDYLSLIRHPYLKLAGRSALHRDALRTGIHFLEDIINTQNLVTVNPEDLLHRLRARLLSRDPAAAKTQQILDEVIFIHQRFLMNPERDFDALCDSMTRAVRGIQPDSAEHSGLFLREYITRAVQAFDELREFYRAEPAAFSGSGFKGFASFIRYFFAERKIHFTGSPLRGVQVMGMLEFRGLRFEQVLVLDTLEGILPKALKYDPLLPHDVKRIFRMRTYTDWEQLYAFNFFSLIGSSRGAHIFWTENRFGSDPGDKSRFIERMVAETSGKGEELQRIRKKIGFQVRDHRPCSVEKSAWIKERLKKMEYSPSSIELYIRCPLRFYLERVLNLKEREKVEADPDAGSFGSIIHGILEDFYRPLLNSTPAALDREQVRGKLTGLVRKRFQQRNHDVNRGIMKIRAWVVREKLADFLIRDLQRLSREKMTITGLEQRVSGSLKLDNGMAVSIRGYLDRIEEKKSRIRILDYKTGSDARLKKTARVDFPARRLLSLPDGEYLDSLQEFNACFPGMQLLTYLLLVRPQPEHLEAEYIFLRNEDNWYHDIFKLPRRSSMDPARRKVYLREYQTALRTVFEDLFHRKHFLANPRDDRYCRYCAFCTACGRG